MLLDYWNRGPDRGSKTSVKKRDLKGRKTSVRKGYLKGEKNFSQKSPLEMIFISCLLISKIGDLQGEGKKQI